MNKSNLIIFVTAVILCSSTPFSILTDELDEGNVEKEGKESWGIIPVPFIIYTPETGWAGGGAAMFYYNPDPDDPEQRPSTISGSGSYTEKEQISLGIGTQSYFAKDDYSLNAGFSYNKFPSTFFGIGPNTTLEGGERYTQVGFTISGSFSWEVYKHWHLGPNYRYSRYTMEKREVNGLLARGDIPGSDGATVSGGGLQVSWDERDHGFYPLKGHLLDLEGSVYRKEIGSSENFSQMTLNYKHFFGIYQEHVFGLQYLANISGGEVPFQLLPSLGGGNIMRGYISGLYVDKNHTALQGEYRFPIFWRFGGVLFGGVGQVAPSLGEFSFKGLKTSAGGGLRFRLDEKQKLNVRLDFALADIGYEKIGFNFYLNALEAF